MPSQMLMISWARRDLGRWNVLRRLILLSQLFVVIASVMAWMMMSNAILEVPFAF